MATSSSRARNGRERSIWSAMSACCSSSRPRRGNSTPEPMRAELGESLGHVFRHPELFRQALTHRSFGAEHNERLEFIGDAVLDRVIALMLYRGFPQQPEGELSRLRANLVNQETLQARRLPVPEYAIVSVQGEAHQQSFEVVCRIGSLGIAATGKGVSRRAAEQAAAASAYEHAAGR